MAAIAPWRSSVDAAACDCDTAPQRAALVALYAATVGASWGAKEGWGTATPLCNWTGVVCDGTEVRKVLLATNGLSGTLPSSFAGLGSLRVLSLSHNSIAGTLPAAALGDLTSLEELILANNALDGGIPAAIWTGLQQLRILNLGSNALTGGVPDTLGSLTRLTQLRLGGNALTGTLPFTLGNLQNLKSLQLWGNQLSGPIPQTWSSLGMLEELELHDNGKLSGSLPDGFFGGMSNLTSLDLRGNKLTGPLPASLGNCLMMRSIVLYSNKFEGVIPASWANLKNVTKLILYENDLSGTLPPAMGSWSSLAVIDVKDNLFSGPIPPEWGTLRNVTVFTANRNRLGGPLPLFPECRTLDVLELQGNMFYGTLPASYPTLHPTLTVLDVTNNTLEGTLPETYGDFKALKVLKVGNNRLHGTLPTAWSQLGPALDSLKFDNNNITGTLPDAYGDLVGLRELVASANRLIGTLPATFARLSKLKILRLLENNLTGTLPHEWGGAGGGTGMSSMNSMDLRSNGLSGTLPPSWGAGMPAIQFLTLVSNQLTGSLPPEWGEWALLDSLLVAGNALNGTLPDAYYKLTSLIYLVLGVNHFTGTLPPSWSAMHKLQYLMLQQTNISGTIPQSWDPMPAASLYFILPADTLICGPLPPSWGTTLFLSQFYFLADVKNGMTTEGALASMQPYAAAFPPCPAPTTAPTQPTTPSPPGKRPRVNTHVAVVSATTVTSSVVGAGVAVVVSPVLGASVVRAGRVVELLKCARDGDDGAPPDVSALRDAGLGYLLAMVVPAIAVAAVVLEAHRRQRMTPSAVRKGLSRLDVVLARWHLPGRFNCVVEALAPAALEVGLALVTLPQSGVVPSDGVLALGAVCIAAAAVALLWFAVHVTVRFAARWRASSGAPKHATGGPSAPALRRAAAWLHASHPAGEWEAAPDRPTFVAAYGSLFDACRERRHWYLALETCLTVLVSVLAALNNADAVSCGVVLKVVGALQLMACVAMLYCRPYLARLTLLTGLLLAVLAAVVAVLSVVPDCGGCAEAAIVLSEVAFWLTVALCVVDVSVRVAIEAVFPLRPANRAPEVPDDRRRLSRRARSRGASGMRGPAPDAPSTSLPLLEPPTRHAHRHGKSRESARGAAHVPLGVLDGVHGMSHRARQLHNLKQLIECIANVRGAEPAPAGSI